jgi:hypothetical protein
VFEIIPPDAPDAAHRKGFGLSRNRNGGLRGGEITKDVASMKRSRWVAVKLQFKPYAVALIGASVGVASRCCRRKNEA